MRTAFSPPSYLPFWLNSFLHVKSSIILPFSSYLSSAVFWQLSFSLLCCLPLFLSSVMSSSVCRLCAVFLCFSLLCWIPVFLFSLLWCQIDHSCTPSPFRCQMRHSVLVDRDVVQITIISLTLSFVVFPLTIIR